MKYEKTERTVLSGRERIKREQDERLQFLLRESVLGMDLFSKMNGLNVSERELSRESAHCENSV